MYRHPESSLFQHCWLAHDHVDRIWIEQQPQTITKINRISLIHLPVPLVRRISNYAAHTLMHWILRIKRHSPYQHKIQSWNQSSSFGNRLAADLWHTYSLERLASLTNFGSILRSNDEMLSVSFSQHGNYSQCETIWHYVLVRILNFWHPHTIDSRQCDSSKLYYSIIYYSIREMALLFEMIIIIPNNERTCNETFFMVQFFYIFRFDNVPILHQNRTNDVCEIEWRNYSHKSIFGNASLEVRIGCVRWVWNARHIFQLWAVSVDG